MKRFLFFMLLIFPYNVFAHEINSIKMDVFINEDGSASVIEEWNTYINAEENSSEGFRSFSMIDNSNIFDFKVIDEDGLLYKNIDNWNSNLSFEEKANTNGIKRFNNGKNIELCWGLSENGYKKYKLYYNISNFVHQYKDYQGIYFNMLSLDYDVNDVDINIKSNNFFILIELKYGAWDLMELVY